MLHEVLDGTALEDALDREVVRGSFPPGSLGGAVRADIAAKVTAIAADQGDARPRSVDVRLDLSVPGDSGAVRMTGVVGNVHDDTLWLRTYSTISAKHVAAAWVRLLALALAEPDREHRAELLGKKGGLPVGLAQPGGRRGAARRARPGAAVGDAVPDGRPSQDRERVRRRVPQDPPRRPVRPAASTRPRPSEVGGRQPLPGRERRPVVATRARTARRASKRSTGSAASNTSRPASGTRSTSTGARHEPDERPWDDRLRHHRPAPVGDDAHRGERRHGQDVDAVGPRGPLRRGAGPAALRAADRHVQPRREPGAARTRPRSDGGDPHHPPERGRDRGRPRQPPA